MTEIFFVLVGEGSTDDALVPHLEKLCILCGADEVNGLAIDWFRVPKGPIRKLEERIRRALELEPSVNVVFVHRDADGPDPTRRLQEIEGAFEELRLVIPGIALVPVQETEAWLLLDEPAIRQVAENPRGKVPLNLPPPGRVESVPKPKELLFETLLSASELTGRRRERFKRTLPQRCKILLERLDPEGEVQKLAAWQRLRQDLERVVLSLR